EPGTEWSANYGERSPDIALGRGILRGGAPKRSAKIVTWSELNVHIGFILLPFALENIDGVFGDRVVTGRAEAKGNPEWQSPRRGLPPT
ncbi:16795_t:CDS:1, partial [Acaulospora colombiana]